jgi:hypothetical protein
VNTDQRIDALAQNLHLLGTIQRDFETEVRQSLHVLTELHRENEKRMAQMMQAITRLGHIADRS